MNCWCCCCACLQCAQLLIATAIAMNNCTPVDCLPNEADVADRVENGLRPASVNDCRVSKFPLDLDYHEIASVEVQRMLDSRPMWLFAKMCYRRMLCKIKDRKILKCGQHSICARRKQKLIINEFKLYINRLLFMQRTKLSPLAQPLIFAQRCV